MSTLKHEDVLKVKCHVRPTSRRVLGYSGAEVNVFGECTCQFVYDNIPIMHTFLVVSSKSTNLLGRDLCQKLGINFTVSDPTSINNLQETVFTQFADYLSDDYKSCVQAEVELELLPCYKPTFCRARPIPMKLQDKVEIELKRLEDEGTITRVYSSDVASPIVCVRKESGDIRICGDF